MVYVQPKFLPPSRDDIPIGKANAVSRDHLCALWNVKDRKAREIIHALRSMPTRDPYAILSSSKRGGGYWRSNDPAELKEYIAETRKRGSHTFAALLGAEKVLQNLGQTSILEEQTA